MKTIKALVLRNIKLFFKDKGLFFTALITPFILLILYVTFLGGIYKDSFITIFAENGCPTDGVYGDAISGLVSGELVSSLLAVCCVTVAFCSNMLMVQDKISGARNDLDMTPVGTGSLAVSYYLATLFSTLLICIAALCAGLVYIALCGWFLTTLDVLLLIADVLLLSMFGTALSSLVNYFLSSQGQISAVGTVVSSCYGFICGAYMPISQFSSALQKVISFLPGTYGTALLRTHSMSGPLRRLEELGLSVNLIDEMKKSFDCDLSFFGYRVEIGYYYAVLCFTIMLLLLVYVCVSKRNKAKKD